MTFPDLLQIFSPKERLSKNPHYALRHDSFFLDAENHAHYRKYGWVKIRQTVRDNEIDSFMGAYLEISRLKGFELGPQFLNTGCLHNPEIRTKTQCVIRENVETILPRMFDMDKVEMRTGGSFVIKPPHIESALAPHQDSSFIDETKDYSLFMWVPFCDVHEDNGPIWVLPGSHLWGNIQRGFGVPWNLVKHVSVMREYMHPVYLEKGDVLIFDPALVHASGVNRSQDVRHAITITVARKNAQLIHYYQDADTKPGSIERYYVDETFFNEYDFSSRPDDRKWKKDTVDHQTFELTEKEVIKLIKEFCRNNIKVDSLTGYIMPSMPKNKLERPNARIWKKAGLSVFSISFMLLLLEIFLRAFGFSPLNTSITPLSYKANQGQAYAPDSVYMMKLNEGDYQMTINGALPHTVTHRNGERFIPFEGNSTDPKVFFLGCSFTYGMGVNDNETFSALFARKHPELQVHNLGRPGLGTLHSLMFLEEHIQKGDVPDVVFLSFSSIHFERNVLTQRYRRILYEGYLYYKHKGYWDTHTRTWGYAYSADSDLYVDTVMAEQMYHLVPFSSYSATANILNKVKDRVYDWGTEKEQASVNRLILQKTMDVCARKGIRLIVFDFYDTPDMDFYEEICTRNNILFLRKPINWNREGMYNLPFDGHPSAMGHQAIFEMLEQGYTPKKYD